MSDSYKTCRYFFGLGCGVFEVWFPMPGTFRIATDDKVSVCACVCLSVSVHVRAHMCAYVCAHVCACARTYVRIHVCMWVYVCMRECMHVHVCASVYASVCVCVWVSSGHVLLPMASWYLPLESRRVPRTSRSAFPYSTFRSRFHQLSYCLHSECALEVGDLGIVITEGMTMFYLSEGASSHLIQLSSYLFEPVVSLLQLWGNRIFK